MSASFNVHVITCENGNNGRTVKTRKRFHFHVILPKPEIALFGKQLQPTVL